MKAQHTPGPWVAKRDPANNRRWRIHSDDVNKSAIAGTAFWLDSDSAEEEEANAHLLASAPELLEALRDMVSDRECLSDATVKFAQNAIAKATGESL